MDVFVTNVSTNLNENWLLNLDYARATIEDWRDVYNRFRPHELLGNLTLKEFARFLNKKEVSA